MPPPQLHRRERSLQLFPQTLDGRRSGSALPLALSLGLQRQQSRQGGEEREELNVVSRSSSDANLSTKDDAGDEDVEVGDGTIVSGNDAILAISSLSLFYRERYLAL